MLPLILIVDDNEEILEFLERILNNKYTILKAEDGKQALKILETEAVQLVISDVMMPQMDGFELCKTIKSHFEHSHIPVILLTAKNTIQSKIEGLDCWRAALQTTISRPPNFCTVSPTKRWQNTHSRRSPGMATPS